MSADISHRHQDPKPLADDFFVQSVMRFGNMLAMLTGFALLAR